MKGTEGSSEKNNIDIEQLEKRIKRLEKQQKQSIPEIRQALRTFYYSPLIELHSYVAREIANEYGFDLLKEYLLERGIIQDFEDYMKFRKEHELTRTYEDENKNAQDLMRYCKSMLENPSPDTSFLNYVSFANRVIVKTRLEIKRKILLKRGYSEDSEYVKALDPLIKEIQNQISQLTNEKSKLLEKKEYYVKKEDAERIFTSIASKKDEIVERMRELPLLSDTHLEPHTKALYYETINNYWFGNFNASICMLSVLLESFLKEIYYLKTKQDFNGTLKPLIDECKGRDFINEEEHAQFTIFAETIRNLYLHASLDKILPKVIVPAVTIDFANPTKPEHTYCTGDSLPTIRSIIKQGTDKVRSRQLIIELVKKIEEIQQRHSDISTPDS